MALQSMTGFARMQGATQCGSASGKWIWEIRSVNARSLDMRLRLPPGFESLEPEIRKKLSGCFARGNLQVTLNFEPDAGQSVPVVNEAALEAVLIAVERLRARIGAPSPAAESLLSIRGVLETGEEAANPSELEERDVELLIGLDTAIAELSAAREAEGAGIRSALLSHVDEISRLVSRIEADPSRTPEAIRSRLASQLAPILDLSSDIDPQRLHQEAALLAAKADISEEIDRLRVHVEAATKMLGADGPVGRKLDFLAQEFNRECNTICSKSNAASVTSAGLEMKLAIDRFREQVQNLE